MHQPTRIPQSEAELQQKKSKTPPISPTKLLYTISLIALLISIIINIKLVLESKGMTSYLGYTAIDTKNVEKICQGRLEKMVELAVKVREIRDQYGEGRDGEQLAVRVEQLAAKNEEENRLINQFVSQMKQQTLKQKEKYQQLQKQIEEKKLKEVTEPQKQQQGQQSEKQHQELISQHSKQKQERWRMQKVLSEKNLEYQNLALETQRIKREYQIAVYNASHNRVLPYYKVFDENPMKYSFEPPFKMFRRSHLHYVFMKGARNIVDFYCDSLCQSRYIRDPLYKNVSVEFSLFRFDGVDKAKVQPDWVVIRNFWGKEREHDIVHLAQRAAPKAKLGLTLMFYNFTDYRNFNAKYREFIFNIMNANDWQYDETGSLNLRRLEGSILMIFTRNVKKTAFPEKKPIKNFIAIQAVMKINENIPYLREWIAYHMLTGIDKFFIYDNNGTLGEPGRSNPDANKYGFKFECMNLTDQQVADQFDQLWEDYYEHIIYVPWQPLDNKALITYMQVEAQGDFINNYEDVVNYVGFIDTDEMLFSINNLSFPGFLTRFSLERCTIIRLGQRKFSNRLCVPGSLVMQINQIFHVNTAGWAQKVFYESLQFFTGYSIHAGKVIDGLTLWTNRDIFWGFNHYNLIEGMIGYSQGTWGSNETRMSIDNSGRQRYGERLRKICNGKCSENFKLACDMTFFRCPNMDKFYPLPPRKSKPKL